jgi:hypothetical protein
VKPAEQLLKSLEVLLEKEARGENIDQEIIVFDEKNQWVLEKGVKSRLASAFGKIKERIKGKASASEPMAAKKPESSTPPPPPKKSEIIPPPPPIDLESRRLTAAQAKKAGLPPAPKEEKAKKSPAKKKPAAKKPVVEKPAEKPAAEPAKKPVVAKKTAVKKVKTEAPVKTGESAKAAPVKKAPAAKKAVKAEKKAESVEKPIKTESVKDFVARGGKIKKVKPGESGEAE